MSYAIVGFGKIGQTLAHAFTRKDIDVTVASRRPPEALAPQARAIGPTASPPKNISRAGKNHLRWRHISGRIQWAGAARAGGEVRQVSANNTSQLCSACAAKVPKTLSVRLHRCQCGLVMDRDQNAARNILERAWPGTGQWSVTLPLGHVLQEAVCFS
jgi:hypothetical protein